MSASGDTGRTASQAFEGPKHRDVARIWERALHRAGLPLALTEGFNPRIKVHFGLALPTGYESMGEYLDVDLRSQDLSGSELSDLPSVLSAVLPEGIDVQSAATVDTAETSLQQAVTACTWHVEVIGLTTAQLSQAAAELMSATSVMVTRERKGREVRDDIRPCVQRIEVMGKPGICSGASGGSGAIASPASGPMSAMVTDLGTQPRGLRPAELLSAMVPEGHELIATASGMLGQASARPVSEGHVCRMNQWIDDGQGARHEPLAAQRPVPHASCRAS